MLIILVAALVLDIVLTLRCSSSIFEHSYLSQMTSTYLNFDRLAFFQQQRWFTEFCPQASPVDLLLSPSIEQAYRIQESQYLKNENFIERASSVGLLENLLGFLFTNPYAPQPKKKIKQQPKQTPQQTSTSSVRSNINEFYNNNYEFREMISLNMKLKARPLIALLFLGAFIMVMFRLTKRSENSKQKIPKIISIFWFFETLQLYFELNWLSLDPQPKQSNSKFLFLGLVPVDYTTNYIPEIMNLILFVVCLFYSFSLVIRFIEIFGQDDLQDNYNIDHITRLANSQANILKDKKAKQIGQGSYQEKDDDNHNEDSEDDFGLSGLTTQPIIQVRPIGMRTALELYHFVIIHLTLFLTLLKLLMLCDGFLFVRVFENHSVSTMDNLEIFPFTPRYLALFTVSFLSSSEYIGKTSTDKTQYNFQKACPFFIAVLHSWILIMRRRLLFTLDDVLITLIFLTSLSLYLTLEYKQMPVPQSAKKQLPPKKNEVKKQNEVKQQQQQQAQIDQANHEREMSKQRALFEKRQQQLQRQLENYEDFTFSDIDDESSTESQSIFQSVIDEAYGEKFSMKKIANKKLQEMLFQQLSQMTEEETRKLFQYGGDFELNNDQDLIQKLTLLNELKKNAALQQQVQATQGGQGQQMNTNLKQTAHKAPTKAPTGRPNPRKRR